MDYLSRSFAAQRLELVGRNTHVNAACDTLAEERTTGRNHMYYFWRTRSVFSQWHPLGFRVSGTDYETAEQYMMHHKALLFGDAERAAAILLTGDPRKQKAHGRAVKNFDADVWRLNARRIVYEANCAKFLQNPAALEELLATDGKLIVEAAPNDRVWGIGLEEKDDRVADSQHWLGTNWLGYALTLLRDDIRQLRD